MRTKVTVVNNFSAMLAKNSQTSWRMAAKAHGYKRYWTHTHTEVSSYVENVRRAASCPATTWNDIRVFWFICVYDFMHVCVCVCMCKCMSKCFLFCLLFYSRQFTVFQRNCPPCSYNMHKWYFWLNCLAFYCS